MKKKALITGGHVTPAIAVIEELQEQWRIVYVGRKHALEGDSSVSAEFLWISKRGIAFRQLIAGRLQRRMTMHTLISLLKIPIGIVQSFFIVAGEKPSVIVSFGGYVALPLVIAGWIQGIPIVTHEQTMKPGFSNKLISHLAKKVCISWEISKKYFKKEKVVFTGNPIRKVVFEKRRKFSFPKALPIIYITGGSLGSQSINRVVRKILPQLLASYNVIHQCGMAENAKDYHQLLQDKSQFPKRLQERYILKTHIDPEYIGWVLQNASVVIARAGANTIFEIIALKKPSILIPLPWSAAGEQLAHAQFLAGKKAAFLIDQSMLQPETLLATIKKALKEEKLIKEALQKLSSNVFFSAASKVVSVIENAAKSIKLS